MNKRFLEIGPSSKGIMGPEGCWDILDVSDSKYATHVHDIENIPLPFKNESYDFVYMSHVLEHVSWFLVVDVLKEIYRILKPEGKVEIWVPNFEYIVKSYLKWSDEGNVIGMLKDPWRRHNPDHIFMLWLNGRTFSYGYSPSDRNWHKGVFDSSHLIYCLLSAGFRSIHVLDRKPLGPEDHGIINLGVEAQKGGN